jgi:hypothetical protein
MGNANAVEKERLRTEISQMERLLIQLSIANATNAGSSSYNSMQNRQSAEKQKGIKLLPELPKLTEIQKKMFADNAGKELYKKTESGYYFESYFLFTAATTFIFLCYRLYLGCRPS